MKFFDILIVAPYVFSFDKPLDTSLQGLYSIRKRKRKSKKKKTDNEKRNQQNGKDTNYDIPAYLGQIYWITVE